LRASSGIVQHLLAQGAQRGAGLCRLPRLARNGRGHHRLLDLFRTAHRADKLAVRRLGVEGRAVGKPAFEGMAAAALQLIGDHDGKVTVTCGKFKDR